MLRSYIKYEARNCMYGKRCGGLPSRNFGGLARRGRSRYHSSRRHRLGAHGVRRSDLVTRQSPLRMKCGTARFWYWARVNVGPYTIIASHITATAAYGYETQIVYMLANDGRIIADDDAKVSFESDHVAIDGKTGKPVADVTRYTYHDADTSIVVSFERQKTILQAILTDRAPLLKRITVLRRTAARWRRSTAA